MQLPDDNLSCAKGILIGLVLSLILWIFIILPLWGVL